MKKLLLSLILVPAVAAWANENVVVINPDGDPVPVKIMSGGAGGAGDASAANQTAVQANAGADASKAVSVQGISGGRAVPISGTVSGTGTFAVSASALPLPSGAATAAAAGNGPTSQITASTSPSTLFAARSTRRQCTVKNTDATITVYIGPASPTLTSTNSMPLKAGESITVRSVGIYNVLAASGSPVVAIMDEYD